MNTLRLIAPDYSELDSLVQSSQPFVLWDVVGKPLIAHWLDYAVDQKTNTVVIYTADRPEALRDYFQKVNYWSKTIEVYPIRPSSQIAGAVTVSRLPHDLPSKAPTTARELVELWQDLQVSALKHLDASEEPQVLQQREPGGWISPRAKIDPTARLQAPYYIGPNSVIEQRVAIGPNAFIQEGSIVDHDAEVEDAIVTSQSYQGAHTTLKKMVADQGRIVDIEREIQFPLHDNCIAAPVNNQLMHWVPMKHRMLALLLLGIHAIVTLQMRLHPQNTPLLVHRGNLLWKVITGQLHLVGILPRPRDLWKAYPIDVRSRLRSVPTGVFSLSDLHDCHDPRDPEEELHALYQASYSADHGESLVMNNLWLILWKQP